MNEYDERFVIMRRQIESLQSAMKFFEERASEDSKKILQMQQSITDISTQLQSATQTLAILRATTMGHGSTAR